jgi:hypothetical protein
MQHDGISVACSILPNRFFRICRIVIHVVSGVALNLSALLQKDSVALARFLSRFADFTIAMRGGHKNEISALIQRKSNKLLFATDPNGDHTCCPPLIGTSAPVT